MTEIKCIHINKMYVYKQDTKKTQTTIYHIGKESKKKHRESYLIIFL